MGSKISTLTRLQAEHLRNHCFIPSWVKKFILPPQHPDSFGAQSTRGFFQQGKWPGGAVEHSPPSSAKGKNKCSYTSTPPLLPEFFIMQVTSSCTTKNLGVEKHD